MTNARTTIFLATMFLALGLYVTTIELPTMDADITQRADAQRLLHFDYRNVTHLVYTTHTERIEMRRDTRNRWRIVEPIPARGDAREIENVLRALQIGRISRVIQDDGATPEQYGLDAPRVTIAMTAGDYADTLALGDPGPLSSTLYAQRGSDHRIVLTTLSVGDFRKKRLSTFRLKDIVLFDPADAEYIHLQTPDHTIMLQRGKAFHGSAATWNFTAPIRAPADHTAVGVFLMALRDLTATGFVDAPADKRALRNTLRRPWLKATIQTTRRSHAVAFFPPTTADGDAYAVTSTNDPVYRIPSSTLTRFPREVFHLQDKRLFGMEPEEIALFTVTTGDWQYTLIQHHGAWVLEGEASKDINQQAVSLWVSRLADLPAEVSVSPTKHHLERYALDSPALEIVGIDRQRRQRGYLALGRREHGLVYAVGAGLPGIYQARSIILTQTLSPGDLLASE